MKFTPDVECVWWQPMSLLSHTHNREAAAAAKIGSGERGRIGVCERAI